MTTARGLGDGDPAGLTRFALHRPIRTGQRFLPWSSVFILSMVWFTWGFHIFAGGLALTFTLRRFTDDPRVISLVTTLNVIIILGPFISYISDKVWTRLGRRRPFLITAWAAGSVAMACFAFLPEVAGTLNAALGSVGIPPVAEFALLVVIVVGYTTLYDLQAPIEPLFLECVPPHQRGRFWAIRGILFSLAVTFFFQVLWPVYDHSVDVGRYWAALTGGVDGSLTNASLAFRGEQWIYIFASLMFFITGGFLLFCIKETKDPAAPNMRFRELGLVKFAKGFFKDVFLAKQNYVFYIVLVIPAMEGMVWNNFGNLMQDEQFKYSKQAQADWAFPMQMLTMFLLTPLSGFYSDIRFNIRWWLRGLLLVVSACAAAGLVYMYRTYAPGDVRTLPDVWVYWAMSGLVALAVTTTFVVVVETMLDYTGREHTRAWVSLLAMFLSLGNLLCLYTTIQLSDGKVIPITAWMIFNVISGTFGALLGTFIGPMIYEYMPRSRMGTINAGRGIYGDGMRFGIMNMGAWWVWAWSMYVYTPPGVKYDYTAMYVLQFALFVPAIIAKVWFIRQVTSGRLPKYGVLEVEGEEAADRGLDAPVAEKGLEKVGGFEPVPARGGGTADDDHRRLDQYK